MFTDTLFGIGNYNQPSSTAPVTPKCGICGTYHNGMCPQIEEIEYYPNGTVKRIKKK